MVNGGDEMSAGAAGPVLFPAEADADTTQLLLIPDGRSLPRVAWLGTGGAGDAGGTNRAAELAACLPEGSPLLVEHAHGSYRRPGLRGHRLHLQGDEQVAGHDWSTSFSQVLVRVEGDRMTVSATDATAALSLLTEVESLAGGALRARHTITNDAADPYLVDALDVSLPLWGHSLELLDFTGRHERERTPQRHRVRDGLWLRENRRGRTGLESATMVAAGTAGFGYDCGEVLAVHVAFSGNSAVWVERDPAAAASIGGGEFLQPGEVVLRQGQSYTTPWVFAVASRDGLDSAAASLHAWQRSLPAHPRQQPVLMNVWEAVYFDHDLDRLIELADRAARVGVERYVLDDGWFHGRRDDVAGLGDWWVDRGVWPEGLHPLVAHVHDLGMQFGLWFEPEMVNPDSELFRRHPDWVLGAGGRLPPLSRNQLVLDLTNKQVWDFLLERMDAVLEEYAIDYVKWDHNRDLLEAGSSNTGTPAAHLQALAHYELIDELRGRHPGVEWESCAAGGGRIDLGILERVQRVWTSDMTDARARQHIQRATVNLVAPEYLGAHVSATTSHQTGRTMPLDFRAATALFGAFGIEWDLTQATDGELDRLAEWTARFVRFRELLHSGRIIRAHSTDPAVLMHGVVAADRSQALLAHVQMDESASNRGVVLRVPHLDPAARYDLSWAGPVDDHPMSQSPALDPAGPTRGVPISGATLRDQGVWLPRRRPETVLLMHLVETADAG